MAYGDDETEWTSSLGLLVSAALHHVRAALLSDNVEVRYSPSLSAAFTLSDLCFRLDTAIQHFHGPPESPSCCRPPEAASAFDAPDVVLISGE